MGALAAERIKLTSVRSPWWCSAIIVVLGLGFAGLMGWVGKQAAADPTNSDEFAGLTPDLAASGVSGFGILVLSVLAALSVTSEYRFGIIRTTFQAMPRRWPVLVAKAVLIGLYGAVLTAVVAFAAVYLAKAVAGPAASGDLVFSDATNARSMYGIPIYAFLCVVLAIGVGALLRQSAAAIALLLLWPLLLENLVGLLGSVGRNIQPFLPFVNANHFLGQATGIDFPWGPWGSLLYFAACVLVVFGAAVVVTDLRDA
ncbi:ABC transporter permease [Skermania piniformis]|uniref:ABC transporter permease n=1 Tax=Skermania pinensis TaxID=39122 RepID=A0ABX8S8R0_9ACTN|nr:ABC transporter permease [Skermania piniformis]QXQ14259.1 ABC transporter permease [Skermania piniformis]